MCDLCPVVFGAAVVLIYSHVFDINEAHTVHSPNNNRPDDVLQCITDKC